MNSIINQLELIDIYKNIPASNSRMHTVLKLTGKFTKRENMWAVNHMLTNLKEIIQSMFYDHTGVKLEITEIKMESSQIFRNKYTF